MCPRYLNVTTYLTQELHSVSGGNDIDTICQYRYFNDGWTDLHKNIYLYIFILGFFEYCKNSGLTPGENDDPVTRT